ncbi:MarR family winged helix-turn-helix transcriptional regulator [Paracoccus suum]|nr:MarR family transcriptional regulator [Paracoccus suum]
MMHHIGRRLSRRFEERTRDRSLTSAQWRLLVLLRRAGEMRQARLAEALEIEPISVSRMIDRMEQGGWVSREPDPTDRRARIVRPTARAMNSLSRLGDVAEAVYAEALRGFSRSEIDTLMGLIDRMNLNLATADGETACGTSKIGAEA